MELQYNMGQGTDKYVRYGDVLLYQGLFHIIFYYYWGEEYIIP